MKNILKSIVVYILQKEAQAVLKKYKPQIVAITGSVGKTSTKDAIYTALSNFYVSRKSQKSFNGELGIPLTILGKPNAEQSLSGWIKNILEGLDLILLPTNYPEWLVLEVGTDRPGDIEAATKWIKPDITIVTRLSKVPVHVEFFPTLEDLFNEKGNLVRATKPGGSVILNVDDEDVLAYKKLTDEKIILFGNSLNADIRAIDYSVSYDQDNLPKGICFDVEINNKKYPIELLGTLGEHHAYHILAALATVRSLNEKLDIASKSFHRHEPTAGRMRLVGGIKNSMIIDDTYN
ncbi:MAG: Mur ligase family protein, partial [bacterium]|nr:Mur ligase family protein [bacterium]